ncbi:MAG: hypothetical protein NT087_10170 [Deltaproteobacteria bacterium]|nr:hypothetical protein [Deltaproteobacteria bacterium]
MKHTETKHYRGKDAWEILAEVMPTHGDSSKLSRFFQGAFSEPLIRAWKRRPESEDYRDNGRISPLERIKNIIEFVILRYGDAVYAHPIAHYVATLCGGVFFPLPAHTSTVDSEALQAITHVLVEAGHAVEEFRQDWFEKTPGKITKKEFSEIAKDVNRAVAALIAMEKFAESKVEKK